MSTDPEVPSGVQVQLQAMLGRWGQEEKTAPDLAELRCGRERQTGTGFVGAAGRRYIRARRLRALDLVVLLFGEEDV